MVIRVRAQDANGDYTFGRSLGNFLVDSSAAVAQLVQTRLLLWQGEWFLDATAFTPWLQQILGKGTTAVYDLLIQQVILGTPGVTAILAYSSSLDRNARALTVTVTVQTQFGAVPVSQLLTPTPQ
jgi:hypothetical protein